MPEALVNPDVLRWARQRAAMPVFVLAEKLKVTEAKVVAWERGEERPTFRQAENFAAQVHVPFGCLFLPEPPEEKLPIPDLRTHPDTPRGEFSATFRDFLRDVMFQRDWFREYLVEQGAEPLPFIGRFSTPADPEAVADDIRTVIGIGDDSPKDVLRISEQCERRGIWVIKTGTVGNDTHRPLSVTDFRGFAIVDDIAPLVVVNNDDAPAAQVFTLAHELAHLWLGQSGISNPYLGRRVDDDSEVEWQCNAIAAEILVPRSRFMLLWQDSKSLEGNAQDLARHFGVSRVVIARRALDLKKIDWDTHRAFFEQAKRDWESTPKSPSGNFYNSAPVKFGKRFTRAVVTSAMSGSLLLRDAGSLLHAKPATVKKLYEKLQTTE